MRNSTSKGREISLRMESRCGERENEKVEGKEAQGDQTGAGLTVARSRSGGQPSQVELFEEGLKF